MVSKTNLKTRVFSVSFIFFQPEVSFTGDYVYSRAEGTVIDWKEDQDLTKLIELRKQRNKSKLFSLSQLSYSGMYG